MAPGRPDAIFNFCIFFLQNIVLSPKPRCYCIPEEQQIQRLRKTHTMEKRNIPITILGETGESNVNRALKGSPMGILRLDLKKPRRLSSEFKFNKKEIISPQPSIDRLSVTFADDSKSDSSKCNLSPRPTKMQQLQQQQSLQCQQDKFQFPEQSIDDNVSDEEDYSASVNAIIQRRASTRRSKKQSRRASSPFTCETPGPERRRSSVFTTSSGDTAITVDDNPNNDVTQDVIFENIKLHKEVLGHVKMQPWNMRKKLKLVLQAKAYIKKHEGQLQERLAQSHSTKDMLARWNIVLIKKWQKWKREITNISMWFIPWELKIKEIESHFGSVVASYFIFLRWLFWVNIVIAVVIISFVTIPEIITADPEAVKDRKFVLPEEKYNSTNFLTLWDFEGVFKYSPLFYGWYTNRDYNDSAVLNSYDSKNHGHGYRLPIAYFVTGLVVYAYSFFATLRKMAENSRMSKLSEKDDECIFSWKLFTAWDYMIGNAETAHNRVASIVMGFKEALLEEAEKKRESRNWKVICFRVLVNTLVVGLLSCSVVAVVIVVRRSTEPEANSTVWRRNEITVVMSLITLFFPMLFEVLGFVEQYHPRKQLRLQLARIMVLNLLNLYSLIFALFDKITDMTVLLQEFKTNLTKSQQNDILSYTTPLTFDTTRAYDDSTVQCFCNDTLISKQNAVISLDMISDIAQNLSVVILPKLKELATVLYSENITDGTTETSFFTSTDQAYLNVSDFLFNSTSFFSDENGTYIFENGTYTPENGTYTPENGTYAAENFTFYYENSSTYWNENTTEYTNYSVLNHSYTVIAEFDFNGTFSIDDLKNMFVDYLTYILSPFVYINSTDWDNVLTANLSTNSSYDVENYTANIVNFTTTDYEYFKSTILPLFNNTLPNEQQTFDTEFYSMYEEISKTVSATLSTTLANLPDIPSTVMSFSTSTEYEEAINSTEYSYCLMYCKTVFDSKISTTTPTSVTSTAMAPVIYGEIEYRKILNYTMNAKLRSLCWETMFGQELLKLTIMDLILNGLSILFMDFIRGIFVRFMNRCWCWDLEKKFPQYGDFKVAENILHLVNNQGMVWMGMFFSPGLVVINVVKLYMMMYLRAWAVLTCNVPHEIIFRASRSNNFYYALLLMMLFLCVLPVGYAVVWIEPSWHCGPFSGYPRIFHIFTRTIRANVPESMHRALDYIASPGIVIPLLLLLVLIIYYLVSLTGALREANNDLKTQLRRERTEERRKMFQLADRSRRGGSGESNEQTPFSKWKKLIGNLPSAPSCDEARQESEDMAPSKKEEEEEEEKIENKGKVFFTKLIKKALGKSSISDEEQDATDTDQHDSLPYDNNKECDKEEKLVKHGGSLELSTLQSIVSRWSFRRNSNREKENDGIHKDDTKGTESKSIQDTAKRSLEKESNKSEKLIEEDTKKLEKKQVSDKNRRKVDETKQLKLSDIEVYGLHSPRSSPYSKKYEESDTSGRIFKEKYRKPKKSEEFKDEYERKEPTKPSSDKQRGQRTRKEEDGNIFLKKIIEAKKAGVFNKDDEKDIEKETRASASYENKHKRVRDKDYSKIVKSNPKRIVEIDEESIEEEASQLTTPRIKIKDSKVTTNDPRVQKPKKSMQRKESSSSIWSDNIPVITISKTYSDENIMEKEENSKQPPNYNEGYKIPESKEDFPQKVGVKRKFVFKDIDNYNDNNDSEYESNGTGATQDQNVTSNFRTVKEDTSFRPRVRCALKKQVTAIDEDIIIHFGNDLEKAEEEKKLIKAIRDGEIGEQLESGYAESTSCIRYNTEDKFLTSKLEAGTRSEEGILSDKSTSDDTEFKEDHSFETVLNMPQNITEDFPNFDNTCAGELKREYHSLDSQTDLELDVNESTEYDTELNSEDTEESFRTDPENAFKKNEENVLQLQKPSLESNSKSQTESSSCYTE